MKPKTNEEMHLVSSHQLTLSCAMMLTFVVDRLTSVESLQTDELSSLDTELLDVLGLSRVCVASACSCLNFQN